MDASGSLNYRKIVFLTDLSPQKKQTPVAACLLIASASC